MLQKRRELSWRGIPHSSPLITVVQKPDGEGHSVLTVCTDEGDFVLDNLTDYVKAWTETPYRFLKRQSEHHTGLRQLTLGRSRSSRLGCWSSFIRSVRRCSVFLTTVGPVQCDRATDQHVQSVRAR